jgi:hypothetical protein
MERRQLFGRAGHEGEELVDVAQGRAGQPDRRNRVARDFAGEAQDAVILGQQHMGRLRKHLWGHALDMGHARERVAGVDRNGRAEPVELLPGLDACVERRRIGCGTAILPGDRRHQRAAVGRNEDVRIDLRADADAEEPAQVVPGLELREGGEDGLHPLVRVLFGVTRQPAGRRYRPGKIGEALAGDIDEDRLHRGRPDVDADEAVCRQNSPPRAP